MKSKQLIVKITFLGISDYKGRQYTYQSETVEVDVTPPNDLIEEEHHNRKDYDQIIDMISNEVQDIAFE